MNTQVLIGEAHDKFPGLRQLVVSVPTSGPGLRSRSGRVLTLNGLGGDDFKAISLKMKRIFYTRQQADGSYLYLDSEPWSFPAEQAAKVTYTPRGRRPLGVDPSGLLGPSPRVPQRV